MQPTVRTEHCDLYLADCRDVLPSLSAVDAVVTDPPFGISYENKRGDVRPHISFAGLIEGDDTTVGQDVITECQSQEWPVCSFAAPRKPWDGQWTQFLVWDKGPGLGGGGDIKTCWKFSWELIQVGGFGRLHGKRDSAVLSFWAGQHEFPYHPTQKPERLMRYLIEKLTDVGSTILDPFAGSGTTAVACIRTSRRCIAIEKDAKYFDIMVRRVNEAEDVGSLFDPNVKAESVDLFDSLTEATT